MTEENADAWIAAMTMLYNAELVTRNGCNFRFFARAADHHRGLSRRRKENKECGR